MLRNLAAAQARPAAAAVRGLSARQFAVVPLRPLQRTAPPPLFPAAAVHRPPPRLRQARFLASKSGDERSWGEIASDAVGLGKSLLKKVGSTVGQAVEALVPSKKTEPLQRQERGRQEDLEWGGRPGGGFLGNLVGRAVGGLVSGALREVGRQMQQAAEQVQEVQSRAAAIIETSSQVSSRLGPGVRCGAPISQSSMTQSINGVTSRQVTLLLPVSSSRGQASAEVSFVEGGSKGAGQDFSIRLRLPRGEVLNLDVDGSSSKYAAGRTIDVEWREL